MPGPAMDACLLHTARDATLLTLFMGDTQSRNSMHATREGQAVHTGSERQMLVPESSRGL